MALFRSDFQGTVYGLETFQHGMAWQSSDTAIGLAGDLAAAWLTFLADTGVNVLFRTDVIWSQVSVSELGATPSDPIVTSAQATINDGGTSTGNGWPPQCAPCISFRTVTAGSRARGRSYLPPMQVAALTAAGRMTDAARDDLTAGLDDFFATMTANAAQPVVISAVGGVWTARPVVTIAVGNVIDTQRSRRSDLAEVYATAAV